MAAVKLRMADRIAQFDWATTPLGAIDTWPASLRTAVDLCLASPVPSFVWWGPSLINIYNDAYAPFFGDRTEIALGQPARELWAKVWPTIADDVERVLRDGVSILHERQRFVEKRAGFPDEMFFTYTFSPIADGSNPVGGIYQIALDETPRVLAERRSQRAQAAAERNLNTSQTQNEMKLARWQAVVTNMVEAVVLVDVDENLCDWNSKALEMFGYSPTEDARGKFRDFVANVDVFDTDGKLIPLHDRPVSRLLRGETIRNVKIRVHRRNREHDVTAICNGTLIHANDDKCRMALLMLHDTAEDAQPQTGPAASTLARTARALPAPRPPVDEIENPADRALRRADESVRAAQALLESMHLNPDDQAFCTSLGQELVEGAIDAYLDANAEIRQRLNGSCVAASLAVALIIVQDV